MTDVKKCAQWLLQNGYAVLVNNQFILTKKFTDELKLTDNQVVTTTTEITKPYIPDIKVSDNKKDIWNQFCIDADIPHRVTAPGGGSYTVRQYSLTNANRLIKIITDPTIDYKTLVESTKNYYKTVTYKTMLSNYFEKEVWRGEYDSWGKGGRNIIPNDGGNPWEDE